MYFETLSLCEFIQEWPGPSGKIHDKDTLTIFSYSKQQVPKMNTPSNALLASCSNYHTTLCFIQITVLLTNWNTFQIFGFKAVFQTPH